MSEENKTAVRKLLELVNDHALDRLGEVIADDVRVHGEAEGGGLEAVAEQTGEFLAAFPDLRFTLEDLIAEGDRVVSRATITGTQTGELEGIPPSGRRIEIADVDIYRIQQGKIVEMWVGPDRFSMMRQLGLLGEAEGERP
jgi:steroid delta-isomerase-like uncharacterized protein